MRTYRAHMIRLTMNDLVPSRPYILLAHDNDDDGAVIRLTESQARLLHQQLGHFLRDGEVTCSP